MCSSVVEEQPVRNPSMITAAMRAKRSKNFAFLILSLFLMFGAALAANLASICKSFAGLRVQI
jgi:hypothetical protein